MNEEAERGLEQLRDKSLYQPNKEMGTSMMKREPYLKDLARKPGEIHRNSDYRIEDLTLNDMDLPIYCV